MRIAVLIILHRPVHEHELSLRLLRSLLVSLGSIVVVSVQVLHLHYQECQRGSGSGSWGEGGCTGRGHMPSSQTHTAKSHQDEIPPYYIPEEQREFF